MLTLKRDDLAFYDSLRGPVPCKIVEFVGGGKQVTIRFTVARNGWRKGELFTCYTHNVFPRKALSYRTGMMGRILPYTIIAQESGKPKWFVRDLDHGTTREWGEGIIAVRAITKD